MVKAIILVIVVAMSGCASVPQQTQEQDKTTTLKKDSFSRFSSETPVEKEQSTPPPLTGRLLAKATSYEQQGDYQRSISTIERSLRIEPENAYLWYRLANAYFKIADYTRAIQFAQRSNSYALDASQRNMNKSLIGHARVYLAEEKTF